MAAARNGGQRPGGRARMAAAVPVVAGSQPACHDLGDTGVSQRRWRRTGTGVSAALRLRLSVLLITGAGVAGNAEW